MSELGKTYDQLRRLGQIREEVLNRNVYKPLGIKTPLEKGSKNGETLFKMHFDIKDQIRDNLKNLIMTQKGERLGFPDFGTSLRQIYSVASPSADAKEEKVNKALSQIKETVSKYMPKVDLLNFYSERLETDKSMDNANIAGFKLANAQTYVETGTSPENIESNIKELNDKNPDVDSVYKITIEYNIPILDVNNETLELFVNTSK